MSATSLILPEASNPTPTGPQAYARHLEEILRVPDEQLTRVNLDVMKTVITVLGVCPKVITLREQLANLPGFDVRLLDDLGGVAFALLEANTDYFIASRPPATLGNLLGPAAELRRTLLSDAKVLAHRGLLDRTRFDRLAGPKGARNVAFDLLALSAVLRDQWPTIAGKTAVDPAELVRAEVLAEQLLNALTRRDKKPETIAALSKIRDQAFTRLVWAYDQVRRGIAYLRWNEGDADEIAPSLYGGRKQRRRRSARPKATQESAAEDGRPRPRDSGTSSRARAALTISASPPCAE
jgi:hypothetical protein